MIIIVEFLDVKYDGENEKGEGTEYGSKVTVQMIGEPKLQHIGDDGPTCETAVCIYDLIVIIVFDGGRLHVVI